jgi:hypothetical protein
MFPFLFTGNSVVVFVDNIHFSVPDSLSSGKEIELNEDELPPVTLSGHCSR